MSHKSQPTSSALRLGRRHFLRGAGSVAIGLPLLEIMADPRDAHADPSGALQRFIGVMIPNGVVPDTWFPTVVDGQMQLAQSMRAMPEYGLPGLEDFQDDLIVFKGIENVAGGRGAAAGHIAGLQSFLTGAELVTEDEQGNQLDKSDWWMSGPSIDQLLVEHWEAQRGAPFAKRSLHIAGRSNKFAFDSSGTPRGISKNVASLFDELFGLSELTAEERERIRAERKSVLDGVIGDYEAMKGRVGQVDLQRVEQHLEAIRALEMRLDAAVECSIPEGMEFVQPSGGGEWENLPDWADMMQDLLVLAFSCDVTRAATFQCRDIGGGQSYLPWLGWGAFIPDNEANYMAHEHHEMSHRWQNTEEDADKLTLAAQWYTGQTAKLLDKLRATPEGSGTLYDSVILLQGSDVAVGTHWMYDMPYVVVGPGAGAVTGNRYVEFSEQVPHNRLLVGIMQAMGMDETAVGAADLNGGPAISLS